ncbi:MAG: hypothetical protein COW30_14785 [Rhodospirillales bacterium CG15_BIG_FIL_POST_REV_8_21_14_020_66_15]|nr:MAG: hypothetical protein COW30_14785 [Rhodospirillales bacterium CG15_BIG_FIL_POST_REV_8_21_14_020_66_15]
MRLIVPIAFVLFLAFPLSETRAETATPYSGTRVINTGMAFDAFEARLLESIGRHKMGLVAQACADCGAKAALNKVIPKNRVYMIFHPRFAVRMLEASVASGIEAPLRLYLTEAQDGTAILTFRLPSHVFGAYQVPALDVLGKELDDVFARIVETARK